MAWKGKKPEAEQAPAKTESPAETVPNRIAELEKEIADLQEPEEPEEEKKEETPEQKEEPKKVPTVNEVEVLVNHEQRLLEMEAKWFRLGGI